MINLIKKAFSTVYAKLTSKLHALFGRQIVDEETLNELERLLIEADTGIYTTRSILHTLRNAAKGGTLRHGTDLKQALDIQLKKILTRYPYDPKADIYLLVGINGSGKTTFAAKLASHLLTHGKRVLLVAADTFRAAAPEQLAAWGTKLSVPVIQGTVQQDPSSVVFTACTLFKEGAYDALIIDTAGRLQTKVNLMKELEKIRKTISKQLPEKKVSTLLTIDAMLGQNSFDQAKLFKESTNVTGIILTKMDGTGKGGIVFSITEQLAIPIAYISFGEQINQLAPFSPDDYLSALLG